MRRSVCSAAVVLCLFASATFANPIMTQPTKPGGGCTPGESFCSWMAYCDCEKGKDQEHCANLPQDFYFSCMSDAEGEAADCRVVGYTLYGYVTHTCTTGGG